MSAAGAKQVLGPRQAIGLDCQEVFHTLVARYMVVAHDCSADICRHHLNTHESEY